MKNKSRTKAIVLTVIFVILTILDVFLTYFNTPDLSMEANPLIAVLGRGWPTLIIVNIVTLIVFGFLAIYSFCRYKTPTITAPTEDQLKKKIAENSGKGSFIAMLGYSLCYSLIISRAIVVLEWITYTFSRHDLNIPNNIRETSLNVFRFLGKLPTKRFDLLVAVVITFILSIVWLIKEEKTKKALGKVVLVAESATIEIQTSSPETKERIAQIILEMDEEENNG